VLGKLSADQNTINKNSEKVENYISKFKESIDKFDAAMDDDFNTAQALGHVFDMVRLTNNFMVDEKNMPDPDKAVILTRAGKVFDHFRAVLGIFQNDADQFFRADQATELRKRGLDVDQIENLVQQRQTARKQKDWAGADAIRKELGALHIVLKDTVDGTSWIIE
jgi:cysteinyl-tRNA synthetase